MLGRCQGAIRLSGYFFGLRGFRVVDSIISLPGLGTGSASSGFRFGITMADQAR